MAHGGVAEDASKSFAGLLLNITYLPLQQPT
jgi:hypothetical protein